MADEFNKMTTQLQESYANLEHKVEDRTRELTESLEQQTATSEILGVISSSPTDIQPVLDAVAESAARLCDATNAQMYRVEGNVLRLAACHGSLPATEEIPITRGSLVGRAVPAAKPFISMTWQQRSKPSFPTPRRRNDGSAIGQQSPRPCCVRRSSGVIGIRRTEVRPFTDKKIALLKTFADQAVIAIENVRLFRKSRTKNEQLRAPTVTNRSFSPT